MGVGMQVGSLTGKLQVVLLGDQALYSRVILLSTYWQPILNFGVNHIVGL